MIHHLTRLALVGCLLAGTAATAQVGPEIAYATSASRAEVHLINANGTGHRVLYRGPTRSQIYHVDIKPGGGELAVEEHATDNSLRLEPISAIKIIKYDANGSIVGSVRTLQLTCLTGSLDYHPTDGTLLYRNCSNPKRISRLNPTTMTSSVVGLTHNAFIAGWLSATQLLYYADQKFWTVSTASLTSPIQVAAWPSPAALDTSTSGNKGLWSAFGSIHLINVTSGQITPFQQPAQKGHFSPDDQRVAYITGAEIGQKDQYVIVRQTDGSGAPTNVAGQGSFTALDWRN